MNLLHISCICKRRPFAANPPKSKVRKNFWLFIRQLFLYIMRGCFDWGVVLLDGSGADVFSKTSKRA
jgi:hypothetical protein